MTATADRSPPSRRRVTQVGLLLAVGAGLLLRVVCAFLVQGYVDRKGKLCVFGDTAIYWRLAETIEKGEPYVVDQMGQPHHALRTPGYPAFLALCRLAFGDRVLPARLVQAGLNAASALLVFLLVRLVLEDVSTDGRVALIAALLASVDPYAVGMSVLALSEGAFFPFMLLSLLGIAWLWKRGAGSQAAWVRWSGALATGVSLGVATMMRPSWVLILPVLLLAWVLGSGAEKRRVAFRLAMVVGLGFVLVMAPWWVRNAQLFGRFVPTALWVGASLYDGLSPAADGSSDMRFLEAPDIAALNEVDQDAELRRRSVAFITAEPARVVWLALVKAGRYFSPWPNADTLRSPLVAVLSSLWTIPLFLLTLVGVWSLRRDARALVLLLGPLVYFLLLHMVFVSSIRYRIPGMLPAFGLAAAGLIETLSRRGRVTHVSA